VKRVCILQVEDTKEDVWLMEYAFEDSGIGAILRSVPHGKAAIDYILGNGPYGDRAEFPMPHLIFLDLKMPGEDGLEVLNWIRTASPQRNLPVIILTSSGQAHDIEKAYSAGANAYVTKPSGVLELIELLRAVNVFWLRFTQLPLAVAPSARQAA
jgi:CheY-like chemotaxis protein